jgi:multiple sugar transport system substrate-binding protein
MAHVNSWYTCCLADVPNWGIAVVPSYNGVHTAKLHADTFRILTATQHPDEAFTVLTYLLNSGDLLQVYGAMPANQNMQQAFFEGLEEQYPHGVDWQVITDSLALADNPSHEAPMPNFLKADERNKAFGSLYRSQPDLDLEAELETWLADLEVIFAEKP